MSLEFLSRWLGLQEGGAVRLALDQLLAALGFDAATAATPAHNSIAFTIAVVTLAAKMSKADGVSSDVEIETFERLFHVAEGERRALRRVFDLARRDVSGYESYAKRLAPLLASEAELKVSVIECLLHVASADGVLHPEEDAFLKRVAELIGIPRADYRAVRRAFVHDPDSPYEILGIAPNASDEALRQRYRDLVREHHPDSLVSKGLPEEFLVASSRRLAAINAAYEAILAERGLNVPQTLEPAP